MQIEFLIIISLAVAATFFVVAMSIALVIHKVVSIRRGWSQSRLYKFYSKVFAELLLGNLPLLPPGSRTSAIFKQYESLVLSIKSRLDRMAAGRRELHHQAIRMVLIDFAKDLTGEASERLVYFSYSFGFVEEQIRLMESKHWWIRAQAARDIGLLRSRKGITSLTAALEDAHPDVRNQAVQSLVLLVGVEALRTILRTSNNLTQWMTIELSVIVMGFKEAAIPSLIEALQSRDQSVVLFSIEMLAQIGFVSAVEPLQKVLREYPNSFVQEKAAEALGILGDERSEDILLKFGESPIPHVRLKAIEALGRIGTPTAVPLLLHRIEKGEISEKVVAARALGSCGREGMRALESLPAGEDSMIRTVGNQVLEELGVEQEMA